MVCIAGTYTSVKTQELVDYLSQIGNEIGLDMI